MTYDPGLSLIPGLSLKPNASNKKVTAPPASSLWAVRPKPAIPAQSGTSPAGGTANGLYGGVIPKDFFSAQSNKKWADQMTQEMAAAPRNPFVEARDAQANAAKEKNAREERLAEMENS